MSVKTPEGTDEQEAVDPDHKLPAKVDFDRAFDEMAEFLFVLYKKHKRNKKADDDYD